MPLVQPFSCISGSLHNYLTTLRLDHCGSLHQCSCYQAGRKYCPTQPTGSRDWVRVRMTANLGSAEAAPGESRSEAESKQRMRMRRKEARNMRSGCSSWVYRAAMPLLASSLQPVSITQNVGVHADTSFLLSFLLAWLVGWFRHYDMSL